MTSLKKQVFENETIINKKIDDIQNELNILKQKCDNSAEVQELKEIKEALINNTNITTGVKLNSDYDILLTQHQLKFQNIELLPYISLDSNKNKKVLLCGFYGAPNLGDELMLETLLNYMPKDVNLTIMLSENVDYDITNFPKCHFIHYPKNMMDINQIAEYFDVIIFGGGALIDDVKPENNPLQMPLGWVLVNLSKRAIVLEKKVILLDLSSSDKLNDKEYINKLDFVLKNASYVSFRDNNSINYLSKLMDVKKVNLSNDIVFANNNIINKSTKDRNNNNIGLIMICSDNTIDLTLDIVKEIKNYFKGKKYTINLIPFYDYANYDTSIYKKVLEKCNDKNVKIIDYVNDSKSICDIIDDQDYIISMRYHGSLVSLLRNKRVLSIIYDIHSHYPIKMNYLYDYYKFDNVSVNYSQITKTKIRSSIKKLFDSSIKKYDMTKYKNESIKEIETLFKKYL